MKGKMFVSLFEAIQSNQKTELSSLKLLRNKKFRGVHFR